MRELTLTGYTILVQEELRALRTAVQLMVKRAEAKSTAEASLQPASSAMEPIQEGGSEADGSGSLPAEEEATPEPAQGNADSPRAFQPHAAAEVSHSTIVASVAECNASGLSSCDPPPPSTADDAVKLLPEHQWLWAEAPRRFCVLSRELASYCAKGIILYLCAAWGHCERH